MKIAPKSVGDMRFTIPGFNSESWGLASFLVNNVHGDDDGDAHIDDEVIRVLDALLNLEVGEEYEHDEGAGGVTKYRRVR